MAEYRPRHPFGNISDPCNDHDKGEDGFGSFDRARIDFRVLDSLTLLSECEPERRIYLRHSTRLVMHLILAGRATVEDRDVTLDVSAGDVILALYGDAHSISAPAGETMTATTLKWPQQAPWNPPYHPPPTDAVTTILSFSIELNYLHPSARAIRIFSSLWAHRQQDDGGVSRALALDLPQIRGICFGPGAPNVLNNLASLLFAHAMRCM